MADLQPAPKCKPTAKATYDTLVLPEPTQEKAAPLNQFRDTPAALLAITGNSSERLEKQSVGGTEYSQVTRKAVDGKEYVYSVDNNGRGAENSFRIVGDKLVNNADGQILATVSLRYFAKAGRDYNQDDSTGVKELSKMRFLSDTSGGVFDLKLKDASGAVSGFGPLRGSYDPESKTLTLPNGHVCKDVIIEVGLRKGEQVAGTAKDGKSEYMTFKQEPAQQDAPNVVPPPPVKSMPALDKMPPAVNPNAPTIDDPKKSAPVTPDKAKPGPVTEPDRQAAAPVKNSEPAQAAQPAAKAVEPAITQVAPPVAKAKTADEIQYELADKLGEYFKRGSKSGELGTVTMGFTEGARTKLWSVTHSSDGYFTRNPRIDLKVDRSAADGQPHILWSIKGEDKYSPVGGRQDARGEIVDRNRWGNDAAGFGKQNRILDELERMEKGVVTGN